MKLGLLGRGQAARTLAPRLSAAGHQVAWWWSRGDILPLSGLGPVDVVLLCVPDGAIEAAARALAARLGAEDEIWLHLSGSRPGDVTRVDPTTPRAAGCLHPLATLPGPDAAPEHLRGVSAGIDGDEDAVAAATTLALALGMRPRRLQPGTKALYHAAAVTAAGHLTALFAQALQMLQATGMTREEAREALQPLGRGALDNLARGLPEAVVTGPVARGDAATVAAHLAELDALDPQLASTYRHLARTALSLSAPGLSPEAHAALAALLDAPAGTPA